MHMQASLLTSAALTAEVAALKQNLERSKKAALPRGSSRRTRVSNTLSIDMYILKRNGFS